MCCAGRQQDATTELEDNMGHKILDVKEDVKHYFEIFWPQVDEGFRKLMAKDITLIIDGKFDDVPRKVEWNERNK